MYHEFCEVFFHKLLSQCGLLFTIFRDLTKSLLQLIFKIIIFMWRIAHTITYSRQLRGFNAAMYMNFYSDVLLASLNYKGSIVGGIQMIINISAVGNHEAMSDRKKLNSNRGPITNHLWTELWSPKRPGKDAKSYFLFWLHLSLSLSPSFSSLSLAWSQVALACLSHFYENENEHSLNEQEMS